MIPVCAHPRLRIAGVCLLVAVMILGCYDPKIGDGTLGCADGGVCPRGFSCGADRRCWRSPHDGAADAGHTDGGLGGAHADGSAEAGSGGRGGAAGSGGRGGAAGSGGHGGAAGSGGHGGGAGPGGRGGAPDAGHGGGGAGSGGGGATGLAAGGSGGGAAGGSGKQPLGSPCGGPTECLSNFCADGVCCQSACNGSCEACNLPGSLGVCTTLPNGADPPASHAGCSATPQASCGTDGKCDGHGACRSWKGVTCAPAHCDPAVNVFTAASTCDGAGSCRPGSSASCTPFTCAPDGTACLTVCTSSSQCASGTCTGGSCGLKPAGASCTSGGACASTFCVDGVCCDQPCGESCVACDVSGHVGTCSPIPARETPHGARAACSGNGACAGFCDGADAQCSFPGSETACPCGLLTGKCNASGQCANLGSLCL